MLDADYSDSDLAARFDEGGRGFAPAGAARPAPSRERPAAEPANREKKKEAPENREKTAEKPPALEPKIPEDKPKEKPSEKGEAEKSKAPFWRRRPLLTVGLIAGTAIVAAGGYIYWDNAAHFESTDDAFIAARQSAIAPKVTGYITSVPVTDNEHVSAGDVIAQLDERDYQVALDEANAQVAAAKDSIQNVEAQRDVQRAQIEASKAQVAQAKAARAFAVQQAARYRDLAQKGAGTVENAQQYTSQLDQQQAAVNSAEANEKVAERQLEALEAQLASAQASLSNAEAQRDQAVLNLGYTTVRASEPGRVVNLTAALGELAQPGTDLTMFVPDAIWIVANFKETQLDEMRPGQPVDLNIDAYPSRDWKGHVASVQPGSGTAFSLLPAQNATGNYVKVVQRVPVKIVLDHKPSDVALGPGMSVVPTVRVDPTPSIYERLTKRFDDYRRRL